MTIQLEQFAVILKEKYPECSMHASQERISIYKTIHLSNSTVTAWILTIHPHQINYFPFGTINITPADPSYITVLGKIINDNLASLMATT